MIPINDVSDANDVNDVLDSQYDPFTGYDIRDIERTLELDVGKKRSMSYHCQDSFLSGDRLENTEETKRGAAISSEGWRRWLVPGFPRNIKQGRSNL